MDRHERIGRLQERGSNFQSGMISPSQRGVVEQPRVISVRYAGRNPALLNIFPVWRNASRAPPPLRGCPVIKPIRFNSVVVWKTGMLGDVKVGILLLEPFDAVDDRTVRLRNGRAICPSSMERRLSQRLGIRGFADGIPVRLRAASNILSG